MATSLGKVGIRNRGRFDASATYAAGEYVYYMGSTFIALQNLPAGMVPQHDGINWNFLAEGASVEQVLQNFAPIEDGATVSRAYPAGDYFLHEDVLYKTTTDIASGGAIIIGTNGNVIQVNIGEEMHALAKNFANEEDSATATTNYSVGQYVIYNEQFYKVTAAISAGQTLVPGTNIEATNVGAQLSALNDSLTISTSTTVIDMNVASSGDTAWHNTEQTIDYSAYKYLVVTCGIHGAVYNSIIVPKAILAITPDNFLRVSAFYDAYNQGCVEIYNTGRFYAFAKTQNYKFDVIVKGFI